MAYGKSRNLFNKNEIVIYKPTGELARIVSIIPTGWSTWIPYTKFEIEFTNSHSNSRIFTLRCTLRELPKA